MDNKDKTQLDLAREALKLCNVPFQERGSPTGWIQLVINNVPDTGGLSENLRRLFPHSAQFDNHGTLTGVL